MFYKDSAGQYLQEVLKSGVTRHYRKRRVLGKGGFAKCYEVTDEKTRARFACKVIDKQLLAQSQLKEKLQTEIDIHRRLTHRNIVKFERVFEDDKFIYILLELCANNTLNELLKRRKVLSEVEVRYYLQQLLQALLYLHNKKIIHRDLKLDNFFLGQNLQVKIGDFGLAAKTNISLRKTICGTPCYIAPQIIQSKEGYSIEVDVWSLGVAAYLLLYGHYPFENGEYTGIASRINTKTYLINPSLSDISKAFVSKMLQVKPHERWTIKQLLEHQFLTYFEIPKTLPRSSLACALNHNFLDQYRNKKQGRQEMSKEEDQFNFMLESRDSPSSPKSKHSSVTQSMSASKLLQLAKKAELPYIFSQKKVASFHYQGINSPNQSSFKIGSWLLQWWQQPKYGLLYQLSDGSIGCRFNDASNIKFHPFPQKISFIDGQGHHTNLNSKHIKESEDRKELLGKLKYLNEMSNKLGLKAQQRLEGGPYVRMYLSSLNVFIIWLSNGNIQCRFDDKSQLIAGSQFSMYVSSKKIKIIFESRLLEEQNEEIILKQTRLYKILRKIRSRDQFKHCKENVSPN